MAPRIAQPATPAVSADDPLAVAIGIQRAVQALGEDSTSPEPARSLRALLAAIQMGHDAAVTALDSYQALVDGAR